ncbi:hypothetical protein K2X30_12770 [bacterium]|nr:hypothetical protein [bacterium]
MLSRESTLFDILSQPTAPFRESYVISTFQKLFDAEKVPYFLDPIGNIVVGVKSKAEYLKLVRAKEAEPLRFFIAHTDHPGFHGVNWKSPTELEIQWHGGSPTAGIEGSSVWLADANGLKESGEFISAELIPSGRGISKGVVRVKRPIDIAAPKLFGGFQFRAPVWKEGELVYTKAADDLVGAFCIASIAIDFFAKAKKKRGKAKPPFLGLLSRAEEVGFIGTIGHLELGWLAQAKRPLLCVSLETSRTLPGADIGKGPVVRLGDRMTVFNTGALKVFGDLAQKVLPGQHQKRVMDGGACEGSAATAYGIPTVGISVPLGNYHNQNFEGGPDAKVSLGPAPEFVHEKDIAGLLTLCEGLLQPKLAWKAPFDATRKQFKNELKRYRPLLKQP